MRAGDAAWNPFTGEKALVVEGGHPSAESGVGRLPARVMHCSES